MEILPQFKNLPYGETFLTANQVKGPTRLEWRSDFDKLDQEVAEKLRRKWEIENEGRTPTFVTERQVNKLQMLDLKYNSKIKIRPTEIKTYVFTASGNDAEIE